MLRRGVTMAYLCIPLHIPFKGARDYLQGPDLANAAWTAMAEVARDPLSGPARFAFFRKAAAEPDLHIQNPDEEPHRTTGAFGCAELTGASGRWLGWLVGSDRSVQARVEYDEDSLLSHAAIDLKAGVARYAGTVLDRTCLETVVALTKGVHNARDRVGPDHHWVVSRFALHRKPGPDDCANIEVRLEGELGRRLTRSVITTQAGLLGDVYFSVAPRAMEAHSK